MDRRRNKGEEKALGAMMKKMILLGDGHSDGFLGCHNHQRGTHCQKRF
jgi:hypothetical protein